MSEFQRFVTYINLYEENSKIRSIGFAKIEKRGGQCKIEIHMRGTGYTGISCPVYLFVRKDKQMEGISLGKIQIMNGVGDGRFLVDGENICKSGYGLEQISGFLIFVNEKVMFVSQWDDQEISREHFYLPERTESEEKIPAVKAAESRPKNQRSKLQENTGDMGGGPNKIQAVNSAIPQENREKVDISIQLEDKEEASTLNHRESAQTIQAVNSTEKEPLSSKEEDNENRQPASITKNPGKPAIKATEAAAQRARQSLQAIQEQPWEQKWQFILENYPVLTPFEGEEEILCIHLELKDLRLLPKRYWYLGNNSFLLHGFFNYRYLILGTMKKGEKREWFIGVPGVFQSQEKVMAAIFGFPEYKSEKACAQKTGQFGYWYRFMDL